MKLKALLIDLSGTLHVGDTPTPGAAEAIRSLRAAGVALRYVSNTSKESKKSLLEKMKKMQLDVREEELFTSLSTLSLLVSRRSLNPLYLLTPSAQLDFPPTDSSRPLDSVVIGLAPDRLNYQTLNEAFRLLIDEKGEGEKKELIVTHKARYYRADDGGLSLGPGPFITALEEATGVTAEIVGKPEKAFFSLALESLSSSGISPDSYSSVGMVGDDIRQDVGPVTAELGMKRILVKTGKYREGDEERMKEMEGGAPDWVGRDFREVAEWVLN